MRVSTLLGVTIDGGISVAGWPDALATRKTPAPISALRARKLEVRFIALLGSPRIRRGFAHEIKVWQLSRGVTSAFRRGYGDFTQKRFQSHMLAVPLDVVTGNVRLGL